MSETFKWCKDKTRLYIWDKQVFCVSWFGIKYWYLSDKLHRENGPAIEDANGNKWWYLNGKRHRENGPAIEYAKGGKVWWLNDRIHRENGPAVEYGNGDKAWWLNGVCFTKSDYWKELYK